jgi:signal transduction histidine kinase
MTTATATPLRLLIVEDLETDAELLLRVLRRAGYDPDYQRVDDAPSMRAALEGRTWDLVVSDHHMPRFDALAALAILRAHDPDVPFVIVSGTIGEDVAVAAMKAGANDYVMKGNLLRLVPAVERELRDADVRRARRRAEQERAQSLLREQAARHEAEVAHRRAAFLADASRVLASSLDYDALVQRVAALGVPTLGTWCALCVLDDDGPPAAVVVHVDPTRALDADALAQLRVDLTRLPGFEEAARTGRAVLIDPVTDAWLRAASSATTWLPLARALGIARAVLVPLVGRGRVLGAMLFASVAGVYDPQDVAVAEDLGRRAGAAIDNARLYRAAQRAVHVREEFLSIASHELKTPLTSLRIAAQTLLRARERPGGLSAIAPSRLDAMLATIDREARRLDRLGNDLLDVSQIGTGRLSLSIEEVDLTALVAEVIERVTRNDPYAPSPVALHAPGPIVGRWDRARLTQVVENLLRNAQRYGRARPIEIALAAEARTATLTIRDQGIGIAPEHLGRIFDRFERAVPAGQYGGLGLGLYIARSIVEALGGSIRVESAPEAGAVFTVVLPRRLGA